MYYSDRECRLFDKEDEGYSVGYNMQLNCEMSTCQAVNDLKPFLNVHKECISVRC